MLPTWQVTMAAMASDVLAPRLRGEPTFVAASNDFSPGTPTPLVLRYVFVSKRKRRREKADLYVSVSIQRPYPRIFDWDTLISSYYVTW